MYYDLRKAEFEAKKSHEEAVNNRMHQQEQFHASLLQLLSQQQKDYALQQEQQQNLMTSNEMTTENWNIKRKQPEALEVDFQDYLKEKVQQSQSFGYWFTHFFELFPIARDLTNSMRSGDWVLYLSAVERATSLFFFFGWTNYSRWTPLFLQDCYELKDKFPLLYSSYMNGGFVVNTNRKGSGAPFDQALEQSYNRTAKVSCGIIGVTRKKDAVA